MIRSLYTRFIPERCATASSTADTALTLSIAGVAGKRVFVTSYMVVISGAAAVNNITVTLAEGATVLWKDVIAAATAIGGKVSYTFPNGGCVTEYIGNGIDLTVTAGGASVVTNGNLSYYIK